MCCSPAWGYTAVSPACRWYSGKSITHPPERRARAPSACRSRPSPGASGLTRLHAPTRTACPPARRSAARNGSGPCAFPYLHSFESVPAQIRAEVVQAPHIRRRGARREGGRPGSVVFVTLRAPGPRTTGRGPEADVGARGLPHVPVRVLRGLDDLAQFLRDASHLGGLQSARPAVGDRLHRAARPAARRAISSSVSHVTATPNVSSS